MRVLSGQYEEGKEKKRSLKIVVFTLIGIMAVILVNAVGGSLASEETVSIESLEELQKIGMEKGYPIDGSYVLTKDIEGGGKTIAAIGTEDKPFGGHFDGQGHTIRNLTVEVKKVREIRTKEVIKSSSDEKTEETEVQKEAEAEKETVPVEKPEQSQSFIVSVDGYPLFEYTTETNPGQVENLCLDGLTAVAVEENTSEKKEAEDEEGQADPKDTPSETDTEKQKPVEDKKTKTIEIHSWEEFKNIGNTKYNPSYTMEADYILVSSIKSDGKKFTPIGTKDKPFTGTFDGQGKKIDISANPQIKSDSPYNGLFGVVEESASKENSHEK